MLSLLWDKCKKAIIWTEMQSSPHFCQTAEQAPLKTFALVPKYVLVMEAANMISLIFLIQPTIHSYFVSVAVAVYIINLNKYY